MNLDELTRLADHAAAVESMGELSLTQKQGEYLCRYRDWKRAVVAAIEGMAAADDCTVSDDDRAGSSYVTVNNAADDCSFEVRISDHNQKYGGPDVAIRMDQPESWKSSFSEIERLINKIK